MSSLQFPSRIELSQDEKDSGFKYRTSVAISAREGLYICKDDEDYDVREKADEHFRIIQRRKTLQTPLHLSQLVLVGEAKENEVCKIIPIFKLNGNISVVAPKNLVTHTFSISSDEEKIALLIDNVC